MTNYRLNHPLEKPEDVPRLSGIAALIEKKAGKEGLLNVFVDGDESARRIGAVENDEEGD
jgi:hypothetical protein